MYCIRYTPNIFSLKDNFLQNKHYQEFIIYYKTFKVSASVSLFHGLVNAKLILVEEQQWEFLIAWGIRRFMPFQGVFSRKWT